MIQDAKERACADCGVQYPPRVMDLHHRDPEAKEFAVSQFYKHTTNRDRVEAEIDKCDVLCANCHRLRH